MTGLHYYTTRRYGSSCWRMCRATVSLLSLLYCQGQEQPSFTTPPSTTGRHGKRSVLHLGRKKLSASSVRHDDLFTTTTTHHNHTTVSLHSPEVQLTLMATSRSNLPASNSVA
eukprot:5711971-Amphidinium_carterae.1